MTPEQRAALAARLAQQDTAALGDQQAADALNVAGTGAGTVWQDVPTAALHRRLMIDAAPGAAGVPAWGLIELNSRRVPATTFASAASAPNAQDQLVAHMTTLVRWVQNFTMIEASDENVRARLAATFGALVTGGWVASGTRDTIVALAQRPAAWGESNLGRRVTAEDVFIARERPRIVQEG
jgi:hypothetical protein